MAKSSIQSTKNYSMFSRSDDNRPTDAKKHKKLRQSMEKYGYLKSFPIVVRKEGGVYVVKDGQHRLLFAQSLGLEVWWVEEDVDFDIATVNSTSKTWVLKDYAEKYAESGLSDYQEGMDFSKNHGMSLGTAFALLAGTTNFGNVSDDFTSGQFKVKDRPWADAVAGIYGPLCGMSSDLKNVRFIEACMAVCRVPSFVPTRLIQGAKNCREKLVAYSTKDAYLDMLEFIYNWKRTNLVGLKSLATMAMRERNVASEKKKPSNGAVLQGSVA
jgi:hypothetical protein